MRRRTVLAGLTLASFSGCLGDREDDGRTSTQPEGTPTHIPEETERERLVIGETATFDDGTSLTVTNPTIQKSIIAAHSQFLAIERKDGLQFVVVDVEGDADFEPSSFVLERNGDIEEPPQTQQAIRGVVRSCEGTCIAISVEAEPEDSVAVAFRVNDVSRAVWALDDTTVTMIAAVPDLRLQKATLTDQGDGLGIEFTVENVGNRDGVFRALVVPAWVADVESPVGFEVAKNETVTETITPSEIQLLEPDEATFVGEPTEDTRYFSVESES